jgi:hypothetical protein
VRDVAEEEGAENLEHGERMPSGAPAERAPIAAAVPFFTGRGPG